MRTCVFLATDSRFALPTAVAVRSIQNQAPRTPIIVVDLDLTSDDRSLISSAAPSVEFVQLEDKFLEPFAGSKTPRAMYARVFVDQLVPDVHRVLYLDADVLVRGSLEPLFSADLGDSIIGAVPMMGAAVEGNPPSFAMEVHRTQDYEESFAHEVGIPPAALYFNAGVMLVDLPAWREANVTERIVQLYDRLPRDDQALLNYLLWNRWMPLDLRWNSKDPSAVIAHFAGDRKPWNADYYENELNLEYRDVARQIGVEVPRPQWAQARISARRVADKWLPPALRQLGGPAAQRRRALRQR